jgi:hypothetical protein
LKGIYMRWVKRLIAVAVLSMSTALAGVGASYGQDKVVRIGFQKWQAGAAQKQGQPGAQAQSPWL